MRQAFRPVRTDANPSSWIKTWSCLTFLALVMSGFLAATGLAPAAMGRKPDLVVTQATKFGPPYLKEGRSGTLSFKDVTENKKKRGHDATAEPSRTGMLLVPMNTSGPVPAVKLASRGVPKLRPGHSDRGAASAGVDAHTLKQGAYKVKVCADVKHEVKERNESNNCKRTGNFYVVPSAWTGPVGDTNAVRGVGPVGSAGNAEKWSSSDGLLVFGKYLGGGVFRYDFLGNVGWNDSGVTTGGCKVSGHGEKNFTDAPGVKLDYFDGSYQGKVVTGPVYTISFTPVQGSPYCTASTAPGPFTREILNIKPARNLLFDQKELKGSFSTGGASWRWLF